MHSISLSTGTTKTKTLVINALFIALTLVATMFINIRLPIMGNGGLIHLGNVPLFVAALVFGKKTGAIAGAFGMALFDVIMGWTLWAPFTFVIVGAMGYVAGLISEKMPRKKSNGIHSGSCRCTDYKSRRILFYRSDPIQ